jgi:Na+-translocating ferredoxin:NAD+ oxidoreductase subunit B
MAETPRKMTRREVVAEIARGAGLLAVSGVLGSLATRSEAKQMVWQIDPDKCTQCGKCATECVLTPSASKCVHEHAMCGYCESCFGYYQDQRPDNATTAENQRCPTNAINRNFVEDPYYQYSIDEAKCIGCAICVKGCKAFGNGSLCMQVRHDRCLNCNDCAIARACPSNAFVRVPADQPYLLRMTPAGKAKK